VLTSLVNRGSDPPAARVPVIMISLPVSRTTSLVPFNLATPSAEIVEFPSVVKSMFPPPKTVPVIPLPP